MERLIEQLKEKYPTEIENVKRVGLAEIEITLTETVDGPAFSQTLQDHLLEVVDENTILKFDINSSEGMLVDSFATTQ